MDEQFEDIPSLPASAKAQSPSLKDALATQSTQAEPAGVDELKAALIQVHCGFFDAPVLLRCGTPDSETS